MEASVVKVQERSLAEALLAAFELAGLVRGPKVRWALERLLDAPEVRSVDQWTRVACSSRSAMRRHFRKQGLPSPIHWLKLVRQVRAVELMHRTGCPAYRAAYAQGYPDPFTFSNQMQRTLGLRPTDAKRLASWMALVDIWIMRERAAGRLRPGRRWAVSR